MKNIYCKNIQPLRGCAGGWLVIHRISCRVIQIQSLRDYCQHRINEIVINEIVYQLYELTADEIKIVEGK